MLELYYTSAPQGLRQGQEGFCTVAASEGLARPLVERLESLSSYRHVFAAGNPRNPVAFAHTILRLAGKNHHVLSRICDAGFDYTQRNNLFAHHVVLEANELPPAGPAWVVGQSGVMSAAWDGRVGAITRPSGVPFADEAAGICSAWQSASGDAGWAGALVDAFLKNASRVAWIVYGPDHDPLLLAAEAIRLLPAASRWDVTFNTFYCSIPASAVCVWRFCLAGTSGADAARRSTSSGLLIDLTAPPQPAPESSWAQMARTGQAVEVARTKTQVFQRSPGKPALIPLADEPPAQTPAAPSKPLRIADFGLRIPNLKSQIPNPQSAILNPQSATPAPRPWRPLALFYVLACLAVGAATAIIVYWNRLPPPTDTPAPSGRGPTSSPVVVPRDRPPVTVIPPISTTVPVSVTPTTGDTPVTTVVHPPTGTTEPVATVVAPKDIVLSTVLQAPACGAGVSDPMQFIPITPAEGLASVTSLGMTFPGNRSDFVYTEGETAGSLTVDKLAGNQPGLVLRWKESMTTTAPLDVLTIQLDRTRARLEFTWKAATIMRRPDVGSLAYWLVRLSPMTIADAAGAHARRMLFAPVEHKPVNVRGEPAPVALPCDLPNAAQVSVEALPEGWRVESNLWWDSADDTPHTPQSAWRLFDLHRHPADATEDVIVKVKIQPGFKAIQSDVTEVGRNYQLAAEEARQQAQTLDEQINKLVVDAAKDMQQNERRLTDPLEAKSANEARAKLLEEMRKPLDAKKADADRLVQARKAGLACVGELRAFKIVIQLPGELRLLVMPVRNE